METCNRSAKGSLQEKRYGKKRANDSTNGGIFRRVESSPEFLIVAGPNGAGKTTFANTYLPEYSRIKEFVNADLIARGISPFNPSSAEFEAGRVSVKRCNQLLESRTSFAWETTLTGHRWHRLIEQAKELGFVVKLYYVSLDSVELSLQRIRDRVAKGGHDIAEDVVRRRFEPSIANCFQAATSVDEAKIYDNSEEDFRLVAHHKSGWEIENQSLFSLLKKYNER